MLYHFQRLRSGERQVLLVGVYDSRAAILRAINRVSKLPGFRRSPILLDYKTDYGDGFNINRIALGEDNWREGFAE
jgi:hypothetical protein